MINCFFVYRDPDQAPETIPLLLIFMKIRDMSYSYPVDPVGELLTASPVTPVATPVALLYTNVGYVQSYSSR